MSQSPRTHTELDGKSACFRRYCENGKHGLKSNILKWKTNFFDMNASKKKFLALK